MARSRNIKPGFYANEDLAECSIWARYIFPGLWMMADREGRLEDRPKKIKGELLRFDGPDMEPLLAELAARKDAQGVPFIVRYRNSDGAFIQISKFTTHQSPHYSEKKSVIKPPTLRESTGDDGRDTPRNLDVRPQTARHAAKNLYFIQRGNADGPIKIGISDRVELRARHLSSSGPEAMTLLLYVAQDAEINEKTLHARFSEYRLGGEWFQPCAELVELIANLSSRSLSESDGLIKKGSQPPDSLIPDSLIPDSLIPDSLIPDSGKERTATSARKPDFQMAGFGEFWAHYPRKGKKPAAEEAWSILAPDQELRITILASLEEWKQSRQWSDKNFIPLPAKWLKNRQWEDDVPRETPPVAQQDRAAAEWLNSKENPSAATLKPPEQSGLPDDFIVDFLNDWGRKLGVTQGADESETEFYAAVVQAVEVESKTGNGEAVEWLEQYGEQVRAMVPA